MDDLISRQEAIYAVNTALFPKINTAKDAEKALRNLPPAQPETHEERTETHACDLISRQAAIDALDCINGVEEVLRALPSAQPEQHEIGYSECANAMLKMWIDNVLTDGEYNRIMDKLNAHWAERREE